MINYLYNEDGDALGFWDDRFVYRLDGTPIGQLNGPSVHKLTGEYVGELYEDMIVDRYFGDLGAIDPVPNPPRAKPVPAPPNRGMVSYGYPNVFDQLLT